MVTLYISKSLYSRSVLYMLCCREDLYDPGWSSGDDSGSVPLIAVLVSISAGCAAVAVLASACLVVVCRRKGGPGSAMAPPAGPAHWSTTVTVTPECRQRGGEID